MKKFKWRLDLSSLEDIAMTPQEAAMTAKEWFIKLLDAGFDMVYPRGLNKELLRRSIKITDKIEAATDDYIELEDAEFSLISETFDKATFKRILAKVVEQVYQAIESAK